MTAHAANAAALASPGPVTPNGAAAAQRPAPSARIPDLNVLVVWSFKVPVAGAPPFEITRVLAAATLAEHDDQPGDYVLTAITLFSIAGKPALVDEDSDLFDRIALDILSTDRAKLDAAWAAHLQHAAEPAKLDAFVEATARSRLLDVVETSDIESVVGLLGASGGAASLDEIKRELGVTAAASTEATS